MPPISGLWGIFVVICGIFRNRQQSAPVRAENKKARIQYYTLGYKPPVQYRVAPPTPAYSRRGMWQR